MPTVNRTVIVGMVTVVQRIQECVKMKCVLKDGKESIAKVKEQLFNLIMKMCSLQ